MAQAAGAAAGQVASWAPHTAWSAAAASSPRRGPSAETGACCTACCSATSPAPPAAALALSTARVAELLRRLHGPAPDPQVPKFQLVRVPSAGCKRYHTWSSRHFRPALVTDDALAARDDKGSPARAPRPAVASPAHCSATWHAQIQCESAEVPCGTLLVRSALVRRGRALHDSCPTAAAGSRCGLQHAGKPVWRGTMAVFWGRSAPRRRTGAAESSRKDSSAGSAQSRAGPAAVSRRRTTTAAAARAASARSNTGGPAAPAGSAVLVWPLASRRRQRSDGHPGDTI